MNILYFHQHYSTPEGAGGVRSYRMARQLISRGHHVTMVCGRYDIAHSGISGDFVKGVRTGQVDGIEVVEFDLPYSNSLGFLERVGSFLRYVVRSIFLVFTRDYDLVFATSTPLTAGIPGIFAKLIRRKPFVFEVRDLWPELPREMGVITNPVILGAMSLLEWVAYKSADFCIGLSPGIVAGIQRRNISEAKTTMIPNGSDIELFGQTTEGAWRPDTVSSSDFMAVFTGSHGAANGLDAVLNAAAELKSQSRTDIKLVMIGAGRLKADLKERAKREQLDNCVFVDSVPKAKLAALLADSDLGLMILANVPAFYYGTSPNKFFDYIAASIPVLNNYPGWLASMITENECGVAIPPDDPAAFADALISLADAGPEARQKMGQRGRALAQSDFDWDKLSEQFADTIEAVVAD